MPNRPLRARDLTDDKILVYSNKKPEVMSSFFGIVHLRQMAQASEGGIIRKGIQPSTGDMLVREIKDSNLNEEEKKIEYAKIIIKYANMLAAGGGGGGTSTERTSDVTGGYARTRRVTSSRKGPSGRKRSKKIKRSRKTRSRKTRKTRKTKSRKTRKTRRSRR